MKGFKSLENDKEVVKEVDDAGDRVCPGCDRESLVEKGLTKWICLNSKCQNEYTNEELDADIEMETYIGECGHIGCEYEAITKGFILLRPEKEGDEPNFHPVLACDYHANMNGFFKTKELPHTI